MKSIVRFAAAGLIIFSPLSAAIAQSAPPTAAEVEKCVSGKMALYGNNQITYQPDHTVDSNIKFATKAGNIVTNFRSGGKWEVVPARRGPAWPLLHVSYGDGSPDTYDRLTILGSTCFINRVFWDWHPKLGDWKWVSYPWAVSPNNAPRPPSSTSGASAPPTTEEVERCVSGKTIQYGRVRNTYQPDHTVKVVFTKKKAGESQPRVIFEKWSILPSGETVKWPSLNIRSERSTGINDRVTVVGGACYLHRLKWTFNSEKGVWEWEDSRWPMTADGNDPNG